jgi:hypothetical protein
VYSRAGLDAEARNKYIFLPGFELRFPGYALITLLNMKIQFPVFTNKESNQLTSWNLLLLDMSTVAQPLENFPAFCGTGKFITVPTRAFRCSISRVR